MRYYTLFLVLVLAILYGCESAEETDTQRQSPYVITSQQDGKNPYKYKFGIDNYGRELTASDAVFAWDFGDNDGIVTKSNPTHVYVENGQKKVTVSLLVDGKRVSADTVILVGEPATVYDSVINVFPGEVSNPLYYKLVSSANSNGGVYNYKWEITGPDGENGEYITYTYPDPDTDEVLDNNVLNHQFQKYGYGYYINLYIKSRDTEKFADTPNNTMYFNTVLPELSIKCEKTGIESGKNIVNCKPDLAVKSGAISDNMKYEWVYYDVNDDGTPVKEGSKETKGQAEVKLLLNDGRKIINLTGSNINEMIGKVQYETEIMLSSVGTLGNVECARPVNNVGSYTDDTRLQYECKAVGYYNKQEDLNEPLPLAKYIWTVAESNNSSSSIYNIDWGGEVTKRNI